jgi:hypothetical protein
MRNIIAEKRETFQGCFLRTADGQLVLRSTAIAGEVERMNADKVKNT